MAQSPHRLDYFNEPYQGYIDYFDENDTNQPIILSDGTSVSFPIGWTDEDADKWRKSVDLQPPGYRSSKAYLH